MYSAVYALTVNACVALLFAVAFAVIRLSYQHQRSVEWFCASYVIGMMTPLSELAVRYFERDGVFMATSYGSLLLSTLTMPMGLAAISGRRLPWRACTLILLAGAITRAAIWGGQRDDLLYEFTFQAPFVAASALSVVVAVQVVRQRSSRLWTAVAILFASLAVYFATKPIFAHVFGSGTTAKAYATSSYALFSQATGGVLIITIGLLVLLIAVEIAMGRTIHESETDPLTGIANRRGFERGAIPMLKEAERTRSPLAVVMFDLDHFKRINDSFGHATGDDVIRAFANLLTTIASPAALVARLGGEEFVMMLDRTTLRGAWHAAQRIRGALPAIGADLPAMTVSGGIAELEIGDTLETLLHRADKRTYDAKSSGRNRICPTPELVLAEAGLRSVS